jgi:hypothetical protein
LLRDATRQQRALPDQTMRRVMARTDAAVAPGPAGPPKRQLKMEHLRHGDRGLTLCLRERLGTLAFRSIAHRLQARSAWRLSPG